MVKSGVNDALVVRSGGQQNLVVSNVAMRVSAARQMAAAASNAGAGAMRRWWCSWYGLSTGAAAAAWLTILAPLMDKNDKSESSRKSNEELMSYDSAVQAYDVWS